MRIARIATAALLVLSPALALAQTALERKPACEYLQMDEVNIMSNGKATRARSTREGMECAFLDAKANAVLTLEVKPAKLPKAELDLEAENLQKIYRTSVKPLEIGDGGFWLTGRAELFFRTGKNIVRVVLSPGPDAKANQAKTEAVARLVESRITGKPLVAPPPPPVEEKKGKAKK